MNTYSESPSPNWGLGYNGHLIDQGSDRTLRGRSRNPQTPYLRRRTNSIANNGHNPSVHSPSDRYSPRLRRSPSGGRCCLFARISPPIIQNIQNQNSCQSNVVGFPGLLGTAPVPPPHSFDGSEPVNRHHNRNTHHNNQNSPQPTQASNAVYAQLLNASQAMDSHSSGSHSYRSHVSHPQNTAHSPSIASQSVCMCCLHQLRLASPQVGSHRCWPELAVARISLFIVRWRIAGFAKWQRAVVRLLVRRRRGAPLQLGGTAAAHTEFPIRSGAVLPPNFIRSSTERTDTNAGRGFASGLQSSQPPDPTSESGDLSGGCIATIPQPIAASTSLALRVDRTAHFAVHSVFFTAASHLHSRCCQLYARRERTTR